MGRLMLALVAGVLGAPPLSARVDQSLQLNSDASAPAPARCATVPNSWAGQEHFNQFCDRQRGCYPAALLLIHVLSWWS